MPTTPGGTAWTYTSASVSGAGTVRIGIPTAKIGQADLTFVVYFHGAGGASDNFSTVTWDGLRNRLLDEGIAFVEGTGGGTQPWGNAASQTAYANSIAYADTQHDIAKLVFLGRSMGGAVSARLYNAMRGTDSRVVGLIVNSGVQDLVWAYDWDGGRWTSAFNSAWGVTSKAQFIAVVAGLNPIDGPASQWDGAHVLQQVGTADPLVPPLYNGYAMRTMYAGHPEFGYDLLDERIGGTHESTNGSNLQVDPMMDFIYQVTGITPPDPPEPDVTFLVDEWKMLEDGPHKVTSFVLV